MLDYKLLEALSHVLSEGGFDAASRSLRLTQSAISQRIRALEEQLGRPVLMRTSPPQPTELGKLLLRHVQQVAAFENEVLAELELQTKVERPEVSIALNNDSLYYWFLDTVAPLLKKQDFGLSLFVDDEERTIELLRSGKVFGAVTSQATPPNGCKCELLGILRYRCVATLEFKKRYIGKRVNGKVLRDSPHVVFDSNDNLQQEFLRSHFRIDDTAGKHLQVPSTRGFLELAVAGVAWALVPTLDVDKHIKSGQLVELTPGKIFDRQLFWHSWYLQPPFHQTISKAITTYANRYLRA